ncbi:hypothetical protein C2E23DRAFT_708043, partial [Lenzites betulinus]
EKADLSKWLEGVEEYKALTIDEMRQWMGLPTAYIPYFNQKIDIKGNTNPWSPEGRQALESTYAAPLTPFWHQWIALTKINDNAANKRNTLILDQVGVGKTLQAVASIASYEWLRSYNEQKKTYPPRWVAASPSAMEVLEHRAHIIVCPPNLIAQWTSELKRYLAYGSWIILPYLG